MSDKKLALSMMQMPDLEPNEYRVYSKEGTDVEQLKIEATEILKQSAVLLGVEYAVDIIENVTIIRARLLSNVRRKAQGD